MADPKTIANLESLSSGRSFGLGKLIGLIFILIGALLILSLLGINLPISLKSFSAILQYGAAIGSVLGGLTLIFKKTETSPVKIK